MAEENAFEIKIHYYLKQKGLHQMDARVLNECERQLLDAFELIKTFTGGFDVEIGPKKHRSTSYQHIDPKKTSQHIKFSYKKKYCGIKVISKRRKSLKHRACYPLF